MPDLSWENMGLGWSAAAVVLMIQMLIIVVSKRWLEANVERAIERKFREWEVLFVTLHERRLNVMEEMLDRLIKVKQALDAASGIQTFDDPTGIGHLEAAVGAGQSARRYFESRRFYLPEDASAKIDALLTEMKNAHAGMATWAERRAAGEANEEADLLYDAIGREGRQAVRTKLPALIADVEAAFRRVAEGEPAA